MSVEQQAPAIPERLAKMYALRARLDEEIAAEEKLAAVPASKRRRRSRYDVPPCGTESAYQRHRYRGERLDTATDPCGCVAAHRAHNTARRRERRLRIRRAVIGVRS
jgi:hypothetical protein